MVARLLTRNPHAPRVQESPIPCKWMDAVCFNIDDPNDTRNYGLGTTFDSPHFGERSIVETFEELLHRYFYHPESKSLGPEGEPCQPKIRGRLRRVHVIGAKRHRIGKEVDRRWEEGDDLEANASDTHRVHP